MDSAINRKKIIRVLKFSIIGLVLTTVILFALSMQTILSGILGAISEDSFRLELNNEDPTADWVITFKANQVNNGLLSEKLSLGIGIVNPDGEYVAVNSTVVDIEPGQLKLFEFTLTIPSETVQLYNLTETQSQDVKMELFFGIHTLGDLVGFEQTMRIEGVQEL
jgi:hypothetical protein